MRQAAAQGEAASQAPVTGVIGFMRPTLLALIMTEIDNLESSLAGLRLRIAAVESENAVLARKLAERSALEDRVRAKAAELAAKIAELGSQLDASQARITADRLRRTQNLIEAAVKRGAIDDADEALKARWAKLIESDPSAAELLTMLPRASWTRRAGSNLTYKRPGYLPAAPNPSRP